MLACGPAGNEILLLVGMFFSPILGAALMTLCWLFSAAAAATPSQRPRLGSLGYVWLVAIAVQGVFFGVAMR